MRKCKTCQSTLRDEIDLMIMSGANWKYLEAWCGDRGFLISETALRNHAKQHIKNYEPAKTHLIKNAPKPRQIGNVDTRPTLVDFEEFFKQINFDPNDLSNIDNHLACSQKVTSHLFFKLSAIADAKLMDYSKGLTRYPVEVIKLKHQENGGKLSTKLESYIKK